MGNELQRVIDHHNLEVARNNLKQFKKEIVLADNKRLEELYKEFLENNEDLSFKDMRLIGRVFDFLKAERSDNY